MVRPSRKRPSNIAIEFDEESEYEEGDESSDEDFQPEVSEERPRLRSMSERSQSDNTDDGSASDQSGRYNTRRRGNIIISNNNNGNLNNNNARRSARRAATRVTLVDEDEAVEERQRQPQVGDDDDDMLTRKKTPRKRIRYTSATASDLSPQKYNFRHRRPQTYHESSDEGDDLEDELVQISADRQRAASSTETVATPATSIPKPCALNAPAPTKPMEVTEAEKEQEEESSQQQVQSQEQEQKTPTMEEKEQEQPPQQQQQQQHPAYEQNNVKRSKRLVTRSRRIEDDDEDEYVAEESDEDDEDDHTPLVDEEEDKLSTSSSTDGARKNEKARFFDDMTDESDTTRRYRLRPRSSSSSRDESSSRGPSDRIRRHSRNVPNGGSERPNYERLERAISSFSRRNTSSHRTQPFTGTKSESSSSSSSDDEYALNTPVNILSHHGRKRHRTKKERADVDPVMDVDKSVTFESVGGLEHHVRALKEMILFPLLYPEVFERFKLTPPKGCLFVGPPGTGKTLMARALANTCSNAGKPVAFFMRKGADCLSKWVGEAEKQLRLLFEKAKEQQPAIIFFDEIDGLAPVRSSKQDYIHSSIVSTLLALMDGLDSRGQVIVIGATNRADALDPALRRPGRFDRELAFTLPSKKARKEILDIHTKDWSPALPDSLKEYIANQCVGYCGADIKALCSEAALRAFRRRYPQVYHSNDKFLIDPNSVQVTQQDFVDAMRDLTPASHRSAVVHSRALPSHLYRCLGEKLHAALEVIQNIFPIAAPSIAKHRQALLPGIPQQAGNNNNTDTAVQPSVDDDLTEITEFWGEDNTVVNDYLLSAPSYRPWLVIHGQPEMGQSHIAGAILHAMEEFPVFSLGLPTLLAESGMRTLEEACVHTFAEARRNSPCVLYIPNIETLWNTASDTLKSTISLLLRNSISSSAHMFVLATSDMPFDHLPDEAQELFSEHQFLMDTPTEDERRRLFSAVLDDIKRRPVLRKKLTPAEYQKLPKAPIQEKPVETPAEIMEKQILEEETALREFRMALRDLAMRVASDRKFSVFLKPVNPKEAPDYFEIIKTPMCLYDIMDRIEKNHYKTLKSFLDDIELITKNANEYNLADYELGRKIIMRSNQLLDVVQNAASKMDKRFVQRCEEKIAQREKRLKGELDQSQAKDSQEQQAAISAAATPSASSAAASSLPNSSSSSTITTPETSNPVTPTTEEETADSAGSVPLPLEQQPVPMEISIDERKLRKWFEKLVTDVTNGLSVEELDKLHSRIYNLMYRFRYQPDKAELLEKLVAMNEDVKQRRQQK